MGLTGFDLHALAHPLFYDSPERIDDADTRWRPPDIGDGRLGAGRDVWVRVGYGKALPAQGWKIHVSTAADTAQAVLDAVAAICARRRTDFKFLRSSTLLGVFNSKYAHRGSAGKFIAVYPTGEAELKDLLEELSAALDGHRGPYILSDLRWNDSSPVFLRYGGFAELWVDDVDGKRVMAVTAPDGTLVPDRRAAYFTVPEWVDVPVFVQDRIDEFAESSHVDMPYTELEPLHFSNGGGVYTARDPATGERIVLKEARPHAGTDGRGEDAVTRLRREHAMLLALADTGYVPRVHGYHVLWEHHFLAQEFIDGETLTAAALARHPLRRPGASREGIADYTAWACETLGKVEAALDAVHRKDIVFGDVHANNVLLRPDGRVTLIDLEAAHAVTGERTGLHGALGFAAPSGTTGTAIDDHGLAAMRLNMFMPLIALTALDPDKTAQLARWAREVFLLPRNYLDTAVRQLDRARHHITTARHFPEDVAPAERKDLLVAGIAASATPQREDRLFPGAPGSTAPSGGVALRHGAAGVLYALHATGTPVDEAWTDWLATAALRRAATTPLGLFDGLHGIATVLDLLGRREEAAALVARACARDLPRGLGLLSGLTGIGLSLLGFHARTGDTAYLDLARSVAGDVGTALAAHPHDTLGLDKGVGGAALLLTRMYQRTADAHYLEQARQTLTTGTDVPASGEPGTLVPSLADGSAGAALALAAWLAHDADSTLTDALDRHLTAATFPLAITPGLLNGTAGQLYVLSTCHDTRAAATARTLWRYAVPYGQGAALPGDNLMRLSMDLATGGAGALLALESHRTGTDLLGPLLAV